MHRRRRQGPADAAMLLPACTALEEWGRTTARRLRRHATRWVRGRRTASAVHQYLETHDPPRLHLGAGHNRLAGWLNTDRDPDAGLVIVDVTRPLPAPSDTFAAVFNEHLIEHLSYEQGRAMLAECRRVLRPGGILRTATPDLDRLIDLRDPRDEVAGRYATWLREDGFPGAAGPDHVFALNRAMHAWGHRFLYDEATLSATLRTAGFVEVRRCAWGDSPHRHLRGLEDHGSDHDLDLARFETMVVEAVVPEW